MSETENNTRMQGFLKNINNGGKSPFPVQIWQCSPLDNALLLPCSQHIIRTKPPPPPQKKKIPRKNPPKNTTKTTLKLFWKEITRISNSKLRIVSYQHQSPRWKLTFGYDICSQSGRLGLALDLEVSGQLRNLPGRLVQGLLVQVLAFQRQHVNLSWLFHCRAQNTTVKVLQYTFTTLQHGS